MTLFFVTQLCTLRKLMIDCDLFTVLPYAFHDGVYDEACLSGPDAEPLRPHL